MSDYRLQISKDARMKISAIKRIKYKLKNMQAADKFYEDTRMAFEHIMQRILHYHQILLCMWYSDFGYQASYTG